MQVYFRCIKGDNVDCTRGSLVLLQVSAINAAMSSLVKTLNVFPRERTIVTRERSKKALDALLIHELCGFSRRDIVAGSSIVML